MTPKYTILMKTQSIQVEICSLHVGIDLICVALFLVRSLQKVRGIASELNQIGLLVLAASKIRIFLDHSHNVSWFSYV